jgi:hypothetical protein
VKKVVEFLATDGAFLYEEHGCRIVDSEFIATFGGTGSITLCNDVIELRLWLERDRLFMDVRALGRKSQRSWHSLGIVRQLLTGKIGGEVLWDRANVDFLREHFDMLMDRFSKSNLDETESKCRELERQRAKRLFG